MSARSTVPSRMGTGTSSSMMISCTLLSCVIELSSSRTPWVKAVGVRWRFRGWVVRVLLVGRGWCGAAVEPIVGSADGGADGDAAVDVEDDARDVAGGFGGEEG